MSRKQSPGTDQVKLALIVPQDLASRVEEFMVRRRLKNKSQVLRELIEMGLDAEQLRRQGTPPGATPGPHSSEKQEPGLTITLRPELLHCIQLAAGMLNLDTKALVQTMLTDHIDEYIRKGEQTLQELRCLLEGIGRKPSE
jgi:hypothetical protein